MFVYLFVYAIYLFIFLDVFLCSFVHVFSTCFFFFNLIYLNVWNEFACSTFELIRIFSSSSSRLPIFLVFITIAVLFVSSVLVLILSIQIKRKKN